MAVSASFTGFEPYRLTGIRVTDRELGRGSYATVLEVDYMGLKCAGKKIHKYLLKQGDTSYTICRFEEECRLLSQIRHPNIVQFLGVYFQQGKQVPMLVMELLQSNLTSCIEQHSILPKETSYSILHDVALGLCYLHSQTPPIIHRDLSSNNILLSSNMKAKISDLGVARMLNLTPLQVSRMTQTPGTPAYMPPEVIIANPKYDTSVDEFSYGILMIHIFSGKWPEPQTGPIRTEPGRMIPVSEAERREIFLEVIGSDHPLMDLILKCIDNHPQTRPPASKMVERLAEMVLQFPISLTNPLEMQQQIEESEREKRALAEEVERKDQVIIELRSQISSRKEVQLEGKDKQVSSKDALDQARVLKQKGNDFFKEHKFEEAIKCYQEAIDVCPTEKKEDLAIFHHNMGAVYDQMALKTRDKTQKRYHLHSVVEACDKSIKLNPRYVKALCRRMKAHHSLDQNSEALLDLFRVKVLDESQFSTFGDTFPIILSEVGKQKAEEAFMKLGPLAPTTHMVKNYFEYFEWNDNISEERLKMLWEQRTPRPRSNLLKGFSEEPFVRAAAKFHTDNYRGIFRLLTDAIDRGHAVFVSHALLLRGVLHSLWREDEKALKDLRDLATRQGVEKKICVGALVRQARIFAGQKKMEKCDICFQKALAVDSNAVDIFIQRGRILIDAAADLNGLSLCIADLEKAVNLAPKSGHAAYLLATAYFRKACLAQSMQLFTKAGSQFEEAIKTFPDFVEGLILYAMFLRCLNQLEKAEELLQTATKLQPENALCHFNLGQVRLSKSGDIADSRRHMEKAIALDCSCMPAYNVLVTYEMQRGNMARVTELSLKATQNTRSIEQLMQTFMILEAMGALTTACEEYGVTFMDLAAQFFATIGSQLNGIMANNNNN